MRLNYLDQSTYCKTRSELSESKYSLIFRAPPPVAKRYLAGIGQLETRIKFNWEKWTNIIIMEARLLSNLYTSVESVDLSCERGKTER